MFRQNPHLMSQPELFVGLVRAFERSDRGEPNLVQLEFCIEGSSIPGYVAEGATLFYPSIPYCEALQAVFLAFLRLPATIGGPRDMDGT